MLPDSFVTDAYGGYCDNASRYLPDSADDDSSSDDSSDDEDSDDDDSDDDDSDDDSEERLL